MPKPCSGRPVLHVDTREWKEDIILDMSAIELHELIAELVQAQKETDRQMKEARLQIQETGLQMKETDRRINKLFGQTGYDIGRMVEAMVEPACLKLFRERGVDVNITLQRLKSLVPGREMEVDILMVNGVELVAVEVNSLMNGEDVTKWIRKLGLLRQAFPQYQNHKVYGAVAALEFAGRSDRFAYKKGLFVLRWANDLMTIANPPEFKGKTF